MSKRTYPTSQKTFDKTPTKKAKRNSFSYTNQPFKKSKEEKKNIDVNQSGVITFGQTTANVTLLNGCAQGITEVTRIGRGINIASIQWRFVGRMAATTTGASSVRLLIVYDRQTNAALPATASIVVADSIESPMNLANGKRFVILCDEIVECMGTAGPQAFHMKGYKKINLPVDFGTNQATIAAINTGGIYSLVWQDGGLLTASPATQLYTRIRYLDA